ncbi:hypothetical protein [Pyxidicoccus trucidator]|uniref:hypothetical protein n=1 Tax=Pyxidicoccus trucidator TaxID=2709662 RepID=UPI0013DA318A|nr:hypothetical protein [Pyxidicoccus trucidator]
MAFDFDRFRSEQVYRSSAPVRMVMADLGRLKLFDAELDRRRALWSKGSLYSGIAAGVAFVGTFLLAPVGIGLLGFGLVPVFLVAWLVCSLMSSRYRRLDLQDRRYELVAHLLQRLRKDIAPDEPVTLELDFHLPEHERNLTGRGTVGPWKTESFVQRWLSLQVRLMDGTHLRLGMDERLQVRRRTKMNPRGKLKSKLKRKGSTLLHVQLRVKPERHPQLAQLGSRARTAVRLPKALKLGRLDVAADRLSMRAVTASDWKVTVAQGEPSLDASRAYLMMLLSLYQVLNYSTSLRKRDAARIAS